MAVNRQEPQGAASGRGACSLASVPDTPITQPDAGPVSPDRHIQQRHSSLPKGASLVSRRSHLAFFIDATPHTAGLAGAPTPPDLHNAGAEPASLTGPGAHSLPLYLRCGITHQKWQHNIENKDRLVASVKQQREGQKKCHPEQK